MLASWSSLTLACSLARALTCVQSCVLRGECPPPGIPEGGRWRRQPRPASVAADHAEATSAMQGAGSPAVSVKVETPEILRLAGSVRTGAWEEDEREAAFSQAETKL